MRKKKTYVLTVSQNFPKTHPRSGESTGFVEAIKKLFSEQQTKIHTIRANYPLWEKRIAEINAGNAVLSIRYWTGKPYNSKQEEILCLEGCGIQKLVWMQHKIDPNILTLSIDEQFSPELINVAANDGLSKQDFDDWFEGYDLYKPMAIIHFTKFRY